MRKLNSSIIAAFIPLCLCGQNLTYSSFMEAVVRDNLEYMAEKCNIDIATANIQAAKVFNDPELSINYGNNQDWSVQMGQSVEAGLSINPDFAGVRRARINSAMDEEALTEASVASFLGNLKYEASVAWAEAWRLKQCVSVLEASVEDMASIAGSDSLRLASGDISLADASQSSLEARTMKGDLLSLRAEYANALMNLSLMAGGAAVSGIEDEALPVKYPGRSDDELVCMAVQNRSDLKYAELSRKLSESNLKLLKASRSFEMGLNLGYSYNTEVRNEIAPAPIYHGLVVGVTVPLKFSAFNKGEVRAAQARITQDGKYYDAALARVRIETVQAARAFNAADEVLKQYDDGLLRDAVRIAGSRKEGYLKGENNILELLAAQAKYREVMQSYIEACACRFIFFADLERAVGCSLCL